MKDREDLLRDDVEAIALPEGRMVGSAGHARARAYLERRLAEIGLVPYRSDFDLAYRNIRAGVESYNLVGVVPGTDRTLKPVLIGAHYDSVIYDSIIAAPSADDNAAAVAIALSAATELKRSARAREIVIALFDAEEPPYFVGQDMGSIRFCEDQADARGFHGAIIMDLVGHDFALPLPGLANLLVATGIERDHVVPDHRHLRPRQPVFRPDATDARVGSVRVPFIVLLGAVLLTTPVLAQTPASDADQAVGIIQKAVVRALNFPQGDLERLRGARADFTPAGWTAFMKHLDGFLDAKGAPAYTSSFVPSGGPTIITQADGVLQLTMTGTLKQTQNTSSTTYPIVVEVRAVGKPLKIDQLKQTICGGRSSTPCQ